MFYLSTVLDDVNASPFANDAPDALRESCLVGCELVGGVYNGEASCVVGRDRNRLYAKCPGGSQRNVGRRYQYQV